jgi:CheY-like chemotaxis protein
MSGERTSLTARNKANTMSPQQVNGLSPTILVVDDEPAIRELAASILEEEGYAVLEASDGLSALDIIEQGDVDLVLSDIMMSRLDGYGLVRSLRRHGYALPVVLMSAVTTAPHGKIAGVRFLPKPFAIDQLCQMVASALRAGKTGRSNGAAKLRTHLASLIA